MDAENCNKGSKNGGNKEKDGIPFKQRKQEAGTLKAAIRRKVD
jgi:hypothetical protein